MYTKTSQQLEVQKVVLYNLYDYFQPSNWTTIGYEVYAAEQNIISENSMYCRVNSYAQEETTVTATSDTDLVMLNLGYTSAAMRYFQSS